MKNVKKVIRLGLDNNGIDDFIIIGLVSAEPDYKLSLAINRRLGISLRHSAPVTAGDHNKKTFSRFSSQKGSFIDYSLVANRSENELLLKKLKNIDYIFMVHDPEKEIKAVDLISAFRETEFVSAVFIMDFEKLKEKNLLYLIH